MMKTFGKFKLKSRLARNFNYDDFKTFNHFNEFVIKENDTLLVPYKQDLSV